MNQELLMTIVIPAYNEAHRLPETLRRVMAFVEACREPLDVLVVDNNSRDATREIAERFAAEHPALRVVEQPVQGKGAAVRKGVFEAAGRYVFICDADLAMPIEELPCFFPAALGGEYDIAIGSREAPGSHRYHEPWYRHVMGRTFNFLVRALAVPRIQDTQCGFKAFRREVAREIFGVQRIDGFTFDVEILAIAQHWGYPILEVGILWYYGEEGSIRPAQDSVRMLRDVFHIRRAVRSGVYDR